MYQTLMKDLEESMQPVFSLADIQRQMLEKITSIRTECIGDCVSASVKQYEALSEVASPIIATEMQLKFMQDFSAKMMNTADQNMSVLSETGDAINKLMDESLKEVSLKNPMKDYFDMEVTFFYPGAAAISKTVTAPVKAVPATAKPAAKKAPAKKAPAKTAATKTSPAKPKTAATAKAKPAAASKPATTARKATRAKAPASKPAAQTTAKAAGTSTTKTAATKPAAATSATTDSDKPAS